MYAVVIQQSLLPNEKRPLVPLKVEIVEKKPSFFTERSAAFFKIQTLIPQFSKTLPRCLRLISSCMCLAITRKLKGLFTKSGKRVQAFITFFGSLEVVWPEKVKPIVIACYFYFCRDTINLPLLGRKESWARMVFSFALLASNDFSLSKVRQRLVRIYLPKTGSQLSVHKIKSSVSRC